MPNQKTPTISFLIVNYKSRDALVRCLHDLTTSCTEGSYEILIANNDSITLDVTSFPVICIEIGKNVGFGKAHNILAKKASGTIFGILNPDTYNFSTGFDTIGELFDHTRASIIGPALRTPSSAPEPWSVGPSITPLRIILNNIGIHSHIWNTHKRHKVGWVSGAALFITQELFHELNGFDEGFFLYYEDVDLCRRASLKGHTVLYAPDYTLTHTSGISSRDSRTTQKRYYFASQERFLRKHYGVHITRALVFMRRLTHRV